MAPTSVPPFIRRSCSLFMASFESNTIAFEPLPGNYDIFIKSIQRNNHLNFTSYIKVFPYGLGDVNTTITAYSEPENYGNTVLGIVSPGISVWYT